MNRQSPIRICVVSSTRSDFGLLNPILNILNSDPHFDLFFIATGTHLSENHGFTLNHIRKSGIPVFKCIAKIDRDTSPDDVCETSARTIKEFSLLFSQNSFDLLMVLGDRYEILAVVQTAMIYRIPVAHIAGGDITEGAYDNSIRFAITQMSHIHFATNKESFNRIVQTGENPDMVHFTGSPGVDSLKKVEPLGVAQLQSTLGIEFRNKLILACLHSCTLDSKPVEFQCETLLTSLLEFSHCTVIFTAANADTGGSIINRMVKEFTSKHDSFHFINSPGHEIYINLLNLCDVLVGNSSSGFYDAPYLGIPVINIGERQKGRIQSNNITNCIYDSNTISSSISKALENGKCNISKPYGNGNSAEKIVEVLHKYDRSNLPESLRKRFYTYE